MDTESSTAANRTCGDTYVKPSSSKKVNRREFLKTTGKGLLGTGAGLLILPSKADGVAPSDKIVVGHIGVGGMGNQHVRWFASHPDVETAAICDVDETHRNATLKRLKGYRPETKAKPYSDFRHVLDRKDIDAVTYATPDHWHALIAILAFQSGKDAYGEKPLSHNIVEGRAMLDNCRRYERVFQLGTQIHAGENYHRVVDIVRSGVLGKIHTVRVWMNGGSPNFGYPPDQAPPKTLDWNFWLGPAPWHPYNPCRCHRTFRHFWDYSGGTYADFWCHISDIVFWSLDLKRGPLTIEARGEDVPEGIATTPRWIDVDYEFPDLKYYWTTHTPDVPGAKGKGIGAQFEGTEGSLVTNYGSHVIFIGKKQMTDIPEIPRSTPRSPGHQRNFLDCVKSRSVTESNLEYVHPMTIPMHLGNISYRLKRKLRWDDKNEKVIGDDAADRFLFRPYRAPWWLPT